jgi:hypothetical protein
MGAAVAATASIALESLLIFLAIRSKFAIRAFIGLAGAARG